MIEFSIMNINKRMPASKRDRRGIVFSVLGVIFLVLGSASFLLYIVWNAPVKNADSPDWSQLGTMFSGASSLALVIISLIVAAAALVQWPSLKADVRKEIEASQAAQKVTRRAMIMIQKRLEKLADELERQVKTLKEDANRTVDILEESMEEKVEALKADVRESASQTAKEVRARAITIMSFLIGTLHSDPKAEIQKEEDKEYLAEAVYLCNKGYEDLRQVSKEGAYMALNSLVYYSTLLRLDEKRELLLDQAREIKNYTEKATHAAPYILTFCRTVGTYGTDIEELKEANFLADRISTSSDVTQMTKSEATHVVALIEKRIKELSSPTTGF
jgi:hypothetical protein